MSKINVVRVLSLMLLMSQTHLLTLKSRSLNKLYIFTSFVGKLGLISNYQKRRQLLEETPKVKIHNAAYTITFSHSDTYSLVG